MEAAAQAGLRLSAPCGGQGQCGKCLVKVTTGVEPPTETEEQLLGLVRLTEGWRLACRAKVTGDATVEIPDSSLIVEHRIMSEGVARAVSAAPNVRKVVLRLTPPSVDDPKADLNRVLEALGGDVKPPRRTSVVRALPSLLRESGFHVTAVLADDSLVALERGDTSRELYGLAVDIGTTTVVAYLCDLTSPEAKVVAVGSDLNSQAQFGDDVISRIAMANSSPESLAELQQAVVEVINDLIERVIHEAGIRAEAIYEIAVVGNTCMSHLFLGVPPSGLGTVPFVASFRGARYVRAADLGIKVHPEAGVYVTPNIGGFVGADTVGVILASELDLTDGLRVAIDIGTNGEIVVARDGEMYACSTAAGPAFEGAKISQGVRASVGAIDRLEIGEDVHYHTIGEACPRGLCGSGLVDAVAELVRVGAVTETGRMVRREEATGLPEKVARRLIENENGVEFVLAWPEESCSGEAVTLTARDIRETQLAKAAIYGGMELMLEELGAQPAEVERLLLAGAFGNYIRRESALAIGLIASLPVERIESVGNAAGVGARLVLTSMAERKRAEEIARRVKHITLSEREGFYDRFADAMMLRPLPN